MQIEAYYIALHSSYEIDQMINRSFQGHPGDCGDYIALNVKRASDAEESRLEVAFCKEHNDPLRGKTRDGRVVLIRLGERATWLYKQPSIVVSTRLSRSFNPCASR